MHRRTYILLLLTLLLSRSPVLLAGTSGTIDFEGLPDSTIVTNQYPGVIFSNTIVLTSGITLNEFEFPPHSGAKVVSDNGGPITIGFVSPVQTFGAYFTYSMTLTLTAFDANNNQVASVTSAFSNNEALSGNSGSTPNELLQVSFAGGISAVTISGAPNGASFAMDDVTYPSNATVPTITWATPAPITYGTPLSTSQLNATSSVPGSFVYSPAAGTLLGAGSQTLSVTFTPTDITKYTTATATVIVQVNKAVLAVAANNASMVYGQAVPSFSYTMTGFVNGDPSTVVAGTATEATTATSTSMPGSYPITFSTESLTAANYTFTYVNGTLTISGGAAQTITFNPLPNVTYGVAPITLMATASSGLPVSYEVMGPATVSGSTLTITGAGTVTVTASQAGNSDYAAAAPVAQSFTVNKAALTVTADNASMVYGQAVPSFNYTIAGFVNGDTSAVVSGTATETTTATSTSAPGSYPISFSTESLAAANYTFNYINGTLTIAGGAAQTIAFGALPNVTYGIAAITLGATASSGLPVSYTVTGPATVAGSTLTITGAGTVTVTASQAGNADYAAATPVAQSFTVNKAAPTVTFTGAPATAAYGTTFTLATTTNASTIAVITAGGACSVTGSTATMISGTGICTLTANWAADSNYNSATATQTSLAAKAATTTTITANTPNPSRVGQAVVASFQVAGNGSPSGNVTVAASTGESCSGTLTASAGSCSLTFSSSGSRTLTATYPGDGNFNSGSSPGVMQTVNTSGAVASVTPTAVSFGDQLVNTTSTAQTVTLSNIGSALLTINGVAIAGPDQGDFAQSNNCGASLVAGRKCTITIRFRPLEAGVRTAGLAISSSDPVNPTLTVSLSGVGIAPLALVSPAALTFSTPLNVPSTAQTVTVNNAGTAPLIIKSITHAGTNPNQFAHTNVNCPIGGGGLAVGTSCTISVTFVPTVASPLTKSASLNVDVAAPAASQSVTLTGMIVIPTFTLLPPSLAFGNQQRRTTSAAQTITLTNTEDAPLVINRVTRTGTNPGQFAQTDTCPIGGAGLAAGANCTINVTFTPTSAGAKSALLNVKVAAPAASQSVSLSGTGQ